MTDKIKFLLLCYRAYNGDVGAALEASKVLRGKVKALELLTKKK